MSMTVEQLTEEALHLSSGERARLADRLVESLGGEEATAIDALWSSEARRRLDDVRQGRVQTIPGEEALAQIRRSLGR